MDVLTVRIEPETPMTAEEFALVPDGDKRRELVRGHVVERPLAGALAGNVSVNVGAGLLEWAGRQNAGIVVISCGFILSRDPDTVRAPSIGFMDRARLLAGRIPEGFFPGPPDLAVEVVSPTRRPMCRRR